MEEEEEEEAAEAEAPSVGPRGFLPLELIKSSASGVERGDDDDDDEVVFAPFWTRARGHFFLMFAVSCAFLSVCVLVSDGARRAQTQPEKERKDTLTHAEKERGLE